MKKMTRKLLCIALMGLLSNIAFAEIAVWHNNRAAEKYTKAAARFEEAGRVHVKKIEAFRKRADEMRQNAAQAAAAVNYLNDFLQQN